MSHVKIGFEYNAKGFRICLRYFIFVSIFSHSLILMSQLIITGVNLFSILLWQARPEKDLILNHDLEIQKI